MCGNICHKIVYLAVNHQENGYIENPHIPCIKFYIDPTYKIRKKNDDKIGYLVVNYKENG